MTETTTTSGRTGRPMNPDVAERFIVAGIGIIADRGLQALRVDNLVKQVRAGKAGFYRRWPDMDHFLADIVRYQRDRLPADDLSAECLTRIAGARVRALVELPRIVPPVPVPAGWVTVQPKGGVL
jgi:AcrR family transcriptional regulator